MPVICEFMGVKIYMYFFDHAPPHVHLVGPGFKAALAVPEGKVLAGILPSRIQSIAASWIRNESAALLENWRRAQAGEPLFRVNPPE